MHRVAHWLALLNAGIWTGAGLFLTAAVGPTFFQPAVTDLIGREKAGLIAQLVLAKYFTLQTVCSSAAVLLHMARPGGLAARRHLIALLGLLVLTQIGGFWLQPKLKALNQERYAPEVSAGRRTEVIATFRRLHGVSQAGNLLVVIGSLIHFGVLIRGREGRAKAAV
jgi:hypothetical protein